MFKIAVSQMRIAIGDYEKNFERMKELSKKAKKAFNAEMIVFPELALQGAEREIKIVYKEYLDEFMKLAEELNIWIIPGSFYVEESQKIYNRLFILNDKGEIVSYYDKIFPWEPLEKAEKGKDIVVFDVKGLKVGVGICYDIFFPEISRAMMMIGAEVLIYPHYTTTSDRNSEILIAQATSILTSSYVFDLNGVGNFLAGKSAVFGPEGEVLQLVEGEEMLLTEVVSKERVRTVREKGLKGVTLNYKHSLEYRDLLKGIVKRYY